MLLADMGADVVLVEEATPPTGRRAATQPMTDEEAARNALRRGKRSIHLDLKSDTGKKVFAALADRADVVLEGFRPGVVQRLGIDYETIAARNPRIVYCSLSGYGQTGPYASLVGHDLDYIALAGALSMIGREGQPPAIPLNLLADLAGGGLMAAYAIVLALFARERLGRGQYIDLAMTDGVLSLLTRAASQRLAGGPMPTPGRDRITGALPHYDVYACKDGRYLAIAPLEPWFLENLEKKLGIERATKERLTALFEEKTRDEWFAFLRDADTCVAPVLDLDEALADPHHVSRGMRIEVEHPTYGKIPMVGPMPKLSETPASVRGAGPRPGEHTKEILEELGYRGGTV